MRSESEDSTHECGKHGTAGNRLAMSVPGTSISQGTFRRSDSSAQLEATKPHEVIGLNRFIGTGSTEYFEITAGLAVRKLTLMHYNPIMGRSMYIV
jgi:hypothetical protein